MKKITYILIVFIMLITLSGCKDKVETLTCTADTKGNNMNAASSVTYTFKNDKVSTAKIEAVFKDITVDNLDKLWPTFKNQFESQNMPVEEEGFKRTVKADDEKYTFTVLIDIDYNKISDETKKKYEVEDFKAKSLKDIKKIATEDDGMTCK